MKKYLVIGSVALSGWLAVLNLPDAHANEIISVVAKPVDSLSASDSQLIRETYILSNQSLLSARLATTQGNGKDVKTLSAELLKRHMQLTEALRAFAKSKQINLPLTMPQGGQRPDGRVDAAPENLRDTSRIQTASGEAIGGKKQGHSNAVDGVEANEEVSRLKAFKGTEFDMAYVKSALNTQNQLLQLFEKGLTSGDAQIKSFSNKYLPQAKQMVKKLERLNKQN